MTEFKELGLKEDILKGIHDLGYKEAFPIQEAVIPVLLTGRDVVGQAHTGSGKTAAFALAMLQEIQPKNGIQGLIMAPTRELAIQITEEIKKFGKYTKIKVLQFLPSTTTAVAIFTTSIVGSFSTSASIIS